MGECWNCNATADDDWSCQACRTERSLAQDLADAGREIERLRAERDAWKTAAMGASTQTVRLREQIIEWAKSLNEADVPRTAAEDALLSVAYGDYKEDERG